MQIRVLRIGWADLPVFEYTANEDVSSITPSRWIFRILFQYSSRRLKCLLRIILLCFLLCGTTSMYICRIRSHQPIGFYIEKRENTETSEIYQICQLPSQLLIFFYLPFLLGCFCSPYIFRVPMMTRPFAFHAVFLNERISCALLVR